MYQSFCSKGYTFDFEAIFEYQEVIHYENTNYDIKARIFNE
jgi:hypothetical protein